MGLNGSFIEISQVCLGHNISQREGLAMRNDLNAIMSNEHTSSPMKNCSEMENWKNRLELFKGDIWVFRFFFFQ